MELTTPDVLRLCRTCKNQSTDMRPLYTRDTESGKENPRMDDMLMLCTNLKVDESDGLPGLICRYCVNQLKSAFNFKQLCESTDQFYKSLISINADKNRSSYEVFEEMISEADKSVESENDKTERSQNESSNCDYIELLENNVIILTCRTCYKVFTTLEGLKGHKRMHTGQLFKCKQCDKQYTRLKNLHRHELTHSKTKVHVCKICNKTITRLDHLRRHLMIHLKERPFHCDACNRGFNRAEHLANHQSKCKGDRIYTCNICGKGFNREDSCEVHQKIHEDQEFVLPTLENLDNIQDYYIEVDFDEDNVDLASEESDVDDIFDDCTTDIPCEVVVTSAVEKENLLEVSRSEIYAEEDPPEIMEEKAKIEEEMYKEYIKQNESFDTTDRYASSDSAESEYFPVPKKKRGRPRKHPFKRGRGRPPKKNKKRIDGEGEYTRSDPKQVLSELEEHMLRHECGVCKKRFTRFTHLRRHLLTHSEKKPFECHLCDKSFARRDNLQQHIKTHGSSERHTCEVCGQVFSRADQLTKHKVVKHKIGTKVIAEKKYQCEICLKGFTTEKYRNVHMKGHTGDRTFQCHICEKAFISKSHLTEHLKFHNDSSKKFLCSECGQRFIRNDYLVIHMRRHRGEKPFKCKFCGKGFPRTTDLTVHERYHTGEKTHLCVICGRGFGRAYNLTVHMRTHTGEKPYSCTYCNAAFAQGNDLKAHVRRHTGERFQCNLCEETFLMGYMLTQHKRSVHGLNIVCNIRRLKPTNKLNNPNEEEPETVTLPAPIIPKNAHVSVLLQPEIKQE